MDNNKSKSRSKIFFWDYNLILNLMRFSVIWLTMIKNKENWVWKLIVAQNG